MPITPFSLPTPLYLAVYFSFHVLGPLILLPAQMLSLQVIVIESLGLGSVLPVHSIPTAHVAWTTSSANQLLDWPCCVGLAS